MSSLVAPLLALAVVAATGSASAAIYVPGQYRDGIYTRPHFLDTPLVEGVRMESGEAKMPKPIIADEPWPPKKLPPAQDLPAQNLPTKDLPPGSAS